MANLFITAIIGAILGFIASVSYLHPLLEDVQIEIRSRPPIVVVDMLKLAVDALPLKVDQAATDEHFKNTQLLIDRYVESGYVVLSRQGIIKAPEEIMITTKDLPANKHLMEEAK